MSMGELKNEKCDSIGLDIGTTTICGVLLDDEGLIKRSVTLKNASTIPAEKLKSREDCKGIEGAHIQDAELIYSIVTEVLEQLGTTNICSIGITGQMHGILYVDLCGSAVSPLYTWQDQRGALMHEENEDNLYMTIPVGYGAVTDKVNEEKGLIPKEAACFCTISSYVAMRLCGKTTPVCHPTEAAGIGGFDIGSGCFENFITDTGRAPKVSEDYEIVGTYKGICVSAGIGDNQAAFLGAVGEDAKAGTVLVNVGTGSQVAVLLDNDIQNIRKLEKRPYFDGKVLAVGSALCGGRAYAILEKFIADIAGLDNAYELMNELFAADKTEDDLVCDTRFAGTRENRNLRGSISNISVSNFTPGALVKGVLNGMVNELYDMFEGNSFICERLVGSGNGIRMNSNLADLFSDKFGSKIEIPKTKEEAACGAAKFSRECVIGDGSV